jgi:hypothetical protein
MSRTDSALPTTGPTWAKQVLSARGFTRKKALRTRHIHGIKVRKKSSRGFKKKPRGCK